MKTTDDTDILRWKYFLMFFGISKSIYIHPFFNIAIQGTREVHWPHEAYTEFTAMLEGEMSRRLSSQASYTANYNVGGRDYLAS